jgi:hypothetical protein
LSRVALPAEEFHVMSQAHQVTHQLEQQIGFLQVDSLLSAVIRAEATFLHVQQSGLDPVTEQELLISRELAQLRDEVEQQVVQLG